MDDSITCTAIDCDGQATPAVGLRAGGRVGGWQAGQRTGSRPIRAGTLIPLCTPPEVKEKLIIELNYLLDLMGENPSEKRDFLLDLINKVYYDMF